MIDPANRTISILIRALLFLRKIKSIAQYRYEVFKKSKHSSTDISLDAITNINIELIGVIKFQRCMLN